MKPRALDLFCCAGGASMGLARAGFDVTGVDIRPQPRYPFRFVQADALQVDLAGYDLIWASPPCQDYVGNGLRWLADNTRKTSPKKPRLIEPVRDRLARSAALTVIENVPGAPLIDPIVLTGTMFKLNTYRRRHFEVNFRCFEPLARGKAFGPESRPGSVTLTGRGSGNKTREYFDAKGKRRLARAGTAAEWRVAIGVEWMTRDELREAIPPAYAEFIGRAALAEMRHRAGTVAA